MHSIKYSTENVKLHIKYKFCIIFNSFYVINSIHYNIAKVDSFEIAFNYLYV